MGDTKKMITAMLVALAILMGYQYVLHWLYPNWKPGQQQASQQPATTQVATTQTAGAAATTRATTRAVAATGGTLTTAPAGTWRARGDEKGTLPVTLGSVARDDKNFTMGVELDRRGAAINSVTLNQFRKSAEDPKTPYTFQEPLVVDGNVREDTRSLQTRSITIDGHTIDLWNVSWRQESADATSARFSVDILGDAGDTPIARIIKTYTLTPRSDDPKTPEGCQVDVSQRVENLTDRPLTVRTTFNGPTVPPRELERSPDQSFIFGYLKEGDLRVVAHLVESEFTKDHKYKEFTKSDKGEPLVWPGTQSAYFNAIARPVPHSSGEPYAKWIAKVSGELLNPTAENADDRRVVMHVETSDLTVAPRASAAVDFETFFGPKWRKTLATEYYAQVPRRYDETLVIKSTSGYAWLCSICTWQPLITFMVWLLTAFHFVTRDWGLAIIGLVLVVRAILHPITKKSQVHMVKMQKMGPELEKLKKKYADDKEMLAKAQMEFYKEQGFTPVLGCLPMFLQMPIWIALWNALQSTFELRQAPFLYGFTWMKDLSQPDYLVKFSQPVSLFLFSIHGINILPILMGVVFYVQTKFQPKPAAMTPEQESQQKMMTWMSTLLFPFMLYNGPSGLNLYILTSTAFGILESKVIRKHIQEREALEDLGPTIVDAPPPPKGGKAAKKEEPKSKGLLGRLMEKAEEIQRHADKQRRQGRQGRP